MVRQSEVWKHYTKQSGRSAKCKLCFKTYATSSNTSNLWAHLLKQHKILRPDSDICRGGPVGHNSAVVARRAEEENSEIVDDPIEVEHPPINGQLPRPGATSNRNTQISPLGYSAQQVTLERTIRRSASYTEGGSSAALLDDAALFMICKDELSLSTTEKKGFNHFAKVAVPLWKPPSRNKITAMMEDKYEILSKLVKTELSRLPSVSLTADCWTETHSTSSYLGVTVHFLLGTEIKSSILGVELLTESHTGVYLSEKILEFCDKWGIDGQKVPLMVTDNAGNAKLAAKLAFGANKSITCFDHSLNLVAQAALGSRTEQGVAIPNVSGVPVLIKKVKDIVTFSHNSCNFSNELKRIQQERGKTEGTCLRLLQDVITRWGSTFLMLKRFLELKEVVSLAALRFSNVKMLSGGELETLRVIRDILHPIHTATTEMSAESTTTASKAIPMVYLIIKNIQGLVVPQDDIIATELKSFVLSELDRRFKDMEKIIPLAKATLLDPRFLQMYFSDKIQMDVTMQCLEEDVKTEMRKAIDAAHYATCTSAASRQSAEHCYATTTPDPGDLWGAHDSMLISHASSGADDLASRAHTEVAAFMARNPVPRTLNPFVVWESIKNEYPHLYKVALRDLPLICTSVPCERLFAGAKRILTDQCSRLTSEHLSQRLFLAYISEDLWAVKNGDFLNT